ncbi:hypothetical protein BG006_004468, partial [Podila minutissima]
GGQILIELKDPFDIMMSLKLHPPGNLEPNVVDPAKALKLSPYLSSSAKFLKTPQSKC